MLGATKPRAVEFGLVRYGVDFACGRAAARKSPRGKKSQRHVPIDSRDTNKDARRDTSRDLVSELWYCVLLAYSRLATWRTTHEKRDCAEWPSEEDWSWSRTGVAIHWPSGSDAFVYEADGTQRALSASSGA